MKELFVGNGRNQITSWKERKPLYYRSDSGAAFKNRNNGLLILRDNEVIATI